MTKQQYVKKAQQSLGYTNNEMAEVLGLGLKSVEGYRALTRGLGHSRTIAKLIIRAGVDETIPHNRVLRNKESS